ncbi:hypothetical protein LUX29_11010 [Aureimonas altamirensis]|uniref:hypothetical protein n=1 Tax=Aureimonas altamirensis TaxID=370622 RepID=UPI001E37C5BF|nr:hypothetical protein [Aureimonas altamirensis]UHD47646.1 hypothetical protein LUX29_11010 [Aureimonas altamirensis]
MNLKLNQLSVDLLNKTASISFVGQPEPSQFVSINLLVPLTTTYTDTRSGIEEDAKNQAEKYLAEAL